MQIDNIEQLDGVELIPGWKVTLVMDPGEMTATVTDDGAVDEITLFGHSLPKQGLRIGSTDTAYRHLFRPMAAAIGKLYADEIEAYERECYARDTQPDPNYGRLLPQEMR